MVFTQCDSCGKTYTIDDKATWNKNHFVFLNFDFCPSCYKQLEENWDEALHKCNHDMSVFKQKKIEIAKAMCSAGVKKKK